MIPIERYIEKNGKKMRYGYTTGSCAAAAAKAAAMACFHHEAVDYMMIDTPKGWALNLEINHVNSIGGGATCYVIKDAGDDPDVTDGIEVYATVQPSDTLGVHIEGGIGVGRVTKKGLRVPVGDAAINPVPLSMIKEEVSKILPEGKGADVIIFVPQGVEISKKTFNSKLGIIGGISILGTSGIVEPMSEEAFSDSLAVEVSVLTAQGERSAAYVFGNFGQDYLGDRIPEHRVIKTSNFVKVLMEAAAQYQLKKVLYVGHIGKMAKVAAGMPNTHSKYGDNRMVSLVNCGKDADLTEGQKEELLCANTTDEAIDYLISYGRKEAVMAELARRCKEVLEGMTGHQVQVECLVFSTIHGSLVQTEGAEALLEELKK